MSAASRTSWSASSGRSRSGVFPLSLITIDRTGATDLIKLPAIFADVAIGWLAWSMTRELGAGPRAALLAGAIAVVNPISWLDSVVWGQVDSVGVVFLLLGIRELWRDRPERAAIFTVIAAVIKPQLGILVPIVAAVTIRRALLPGGGSGDDPAPGSPDGPDEGATTLGWERRVQGPIRILTTGLVGFATAVALAAPFGMSIPQLLGQVAKAAGGYPILSVNAYNPWALVESDGSGIAANRAWVCDVVVPSGQANLDCSEALTFGAVPAVVVGTALLLAAVVAISLVIARRPDRRTILVGVAAMALAFFVLPTRVHERYLFPFFAIAAILAAVSVRWRICFVIVGLATFFNMYAVLTELYPTNPQITDWIGNFLGWFGVTVDTGPILTSWEGVALMALAHGAGFAWGAVQLRDGALARLGGEIRARAMGLVGHRATEPADEFEPAPEHPEGPPVPAPEPLPAPVPAPRPVAVARAPVYESPYWRERPSFAEVGAMGWLRSRFFDRPIRPDRTAVLHGERGGRLDRLDLWVLTVIVVAALVLRVWRLDEPFRMHFDEVYHARTATEFLQHWRYGISKYIYEWTHPHLAKYAIAGGIAAFGDDRVSATAELGVPTRAAAVELRWLDSLNPSRRSGERFHVATGSEIRSYDLHTRQLVNAAALPGAAALAVDNNGHLLYAATDDGRLVTIDLQPLDAARAAAADALPPEPLELATLDGPVVALHVTSDGSGLLAELDDGSVAVLDPGTGAELGRLAFDEIAGFADARTATAVVATPADVTDAVAEASQLADILDGDASAYEAALDRGIARVVLDQVAASGDARTELNTAIADGLLPGIEVDSVPRVAVAHAGGIALVSTIDGTIVQEVALEGGAQGVALVEVDDPALYVTNDAPNGPQFVQIGVGGDSAKDAAVLRAGGPLPGRGSWVGFDEATDQVHVLGAPPAGRGADQAATIYVIEPHANAVYADAPLPYAPVSLALDVNGRFPSEDRQHILTLDSDGTMATVEAGKHAFAWRLPGVLAGVGMAALLYLLARILFQRRSVAIIAGVLTCLDGMFFVQSRIAMNDAYVAFFIIAAYTLFAAIWTGWWRWRGAFWLAMPAIGVLLGLALASKWVAAYAIGAIGILILARSALGRITLLVGMLAATTVLGYMAMSVPVRDANTPPPSGWTLPGGIVIEGNLTFGLIMVALSLIAVVVTVLHPIEWSSDEVRFAVGAPMVAGAALGLAGMAGLGPRYEVDNGEFLGRFSFQLFLAAGFTLVILAIGVYVSFVVAGRLGFGPLSPPPEADDPVRLLEPPAPAPTGWLRPGWGFGIPVAWMAACLLAIPIAVYVTSYLPWAMVEDHVIVETAPRLENGVEVSGWPVARPGNTQTLAELTTAMYEYHNELGDAHPASSPWWAWPLDLKPVWFYQESFAGGTSGAIYDTGTLAIWWLGIPAMAFVVWQAFRRRSLPLALIGIAFACQWIAWARIDRPAFQYHYYTSLPFVVLALAYFVAEIWHGASARTWLLARLAAAAAIIGPAALWLLHRPLCGFANVNGIYKPAPSPACPTLIPEMVLTQRTLAFAAIVGLAVFLLLRQFVRLRPPDSDEPPERALASLLPIGVVATFAIGALGLASAAFGEVELIRLRSIAVEPIALVVLLPLLGVAAVVIGARDARRFVVGLLSVTAATFLVLYPNISGLPLPSAVFNAYQGLLPTYLFPFQFAVSTIDRSGAGPNLLDTGPALLFGTLVVTSLVLAYSAWVWRIALAERQIEDPDPDAAYAAGGGT